MRIKASKPVSKELREMAEARMRADQEAASNRARSVMVGTCFGGTTEVSMRGNDGKILWAPFMPAEVVELIHQLAANIGCHIHITPRDDFSSWRNWRLTEHEKKRIDGYVPFPSSNGPHVQLGTSTFTAKDQALADSYFPPELVKNEQEKELENAVAAQKDLNRRTIESTPTST